MRPEPSLSHPARRIKKTLLAALALPALAGVGAVAQQTPVNTLHGVVVSKKDGKPLAGARVAMAHTEKGFLMLGQGGEINTFGSDEKILLFFTKRNGKTTCEATTDADGCFTFKSFTSPGHKYNFVAAHAEHGVALLYDVVPNDHQDKPLRIEMDEPSFIATDWKPPSFKPSFSLKRWETVDVSLVPDAAETQQRGNIWFSMYAKSPRDDEQGLKLGPLPGGLNYRLCRQLYMNPPGYSATLFEREVFVKPGQTVQVAVCGKEGTSISGRVTGRDDKPLANVSVTVTTTAEPRLVIGAVTDDEGDYTIAGVPPGKHNFALLRHAVRTKPG